MSEDGSSDIEVTHGPTRFGVDSGNDTMKSVIEIASGGGDVIIVAESGDKLDTPWWRREKRRNMRCKKAFRRYRNAEKRCAFTQLV